MTPFLTTNAIVLWFLFGIWQRDAHNMIFKLLFLGLAVWNTVLLLNAIGFVIKR